MSEEKQKLETDCRNNKEVENFILQYIKMKEQAAELEDIHRRNNLWFTGIVSERWEGSKAKVKVFLQEKLGLEI